ncbi:hypothetical protein JCM31598_26460 [Desulfonatronum parangueonense]
MAWENRVRHAHQVRAVHFQDMVRKPGPIPAGIGGADKSSNAAPGNAVGPEPDPVQLLKKTDMRESPGRAAAKDKAQLRGTEILQRKVWYRIAIYR